MFTDATEEEINKVMEQSWNAFLQYRKMPLKRRSEFMKAMAKELENGGDEVIQTAAEETHLPEARLRNERARTIFQLNSYATACESGEWLEARIDTAIADRKPPKPDIRKMLLPLGPIVVFGSSNFPFAYSTAGGDTACAFAAGCPVIVKAHPAHAQTSEIVAGAIMKAAEMCQMPKGIFAHIHGAGIEVGKCLVIHKHTKAVGFTGSFSGGKQLFDWGNQRKIPIPVFSEMGSVNPVFLLPQKLASSATEIAHMYASSITVGVGQFCTNPGLIIGMEGNSLQQFITTLGEEIKKVAPQKMLHTGIAKAYDEKKKNALQQSDVSVIAVSEIDRDTNEGRPVIATVSGKAFLKNPILHQEVFGPFSLIIRCENIEEMTEVATHLEGQLTATLIATEEDVLSHTDLVEAVKNLCGRLIMNSVPTGVEVCLSMQHGGPFPATTDARFTSVGSDGIKRFARPVAFQNWPDSLLPDELKNDNPLRIWRTVNNQLSKDAVV
jgi:NADP-dependent aldehyde dehydrogenase